MVYWDSWSDYATYYESYEYPLGTAEERNKTDTQVCLTSFGISYGPEFIYNVKVFYNAELPTYDSDVCEDSRL
jgi:hypothetical protein